MRYHSNGKLLLTGEYLVLDGALALAVPANFGQSLEVSPRQDNVISWYSFNHKEEVWFKTEISIGEIVEPNYETEKIDLNNSEQKGPALKLKQILREAHLLNNGILHSRTGFNVKTKLDFPQEWGLGSSSTLINNIAQWFQVDAYTLLKTTFGGSGYDIAAAQISHPFTYQLGDTKRNILTADFDPEFKEELFFVYLNRKQNSRDSISKYKKQELPGLEENIEKISSLTESIIHCESLAEFELLIEIHETLISKIIKTPKVKSRLFGDFNGAVKSLGGWGGDFILATGNMEAQEYFIKKGYNTVIPYSQMVM